MDPEQRDANRLNWEDRVPIHVRSEFYNVDRWLRDRAGPRPWEAALLGNVTGAGLVHLQCHFGLDTLTWARAGASVTGLDFSERAIRAACDLARRAGLEDRASFVCADVHDAVTVLGQERFDIVYVSLGALCWLPSIDRWAEQVVGLLRPGGTLFLHDGHPVAWAMSDSEPRLDHSYFEEPTPYVDDDGHTYTDGEETLEHPTSYEWNHGVGQTVMALVRRGMRLDLLEEHDWTVFPKFPWLVESGDGRWGPPPGGPRLPLSFTVIASRPAQPGPGAGAATSRL